MLPNLLARDIGEGLKSFIVTGFETTTPYFAGMFSRFANEPGGFLKGPWLSLGLPFQAGSSSRDYFSQIQTEYPPHVHQQQAWERLRSDAAPRSTLVATGTGSGKTECFLYPLLDHCRRADGPGVKAIIIYPMNALATDQAKRFAAAIHKNPALRQKLTVGLFVGESEKTPHTTMGEDWVITDKEMLRRQPPDILLTNYKMLDFLLLRPVDFPLWRKNSSETLRYLVVDELHSFDGAQGTDLACLIRRLKARLHTPPQHLVAIGTSATLGSSDEKSHLLDYAAKIFQESFDEEAIIGEYRQDRNTFLGGTLIEHQLFPPADLIERLSPGKYSDISSYLTAQYSLFFPELPSAHPDDPQWCSLLGQQLKGHILFVNLLNLLIQQPRPLPELAKELAKTLPLGESRLHSAEILDSLCALVACARHPENPKRPLVDLRLQFWVRELRRMVTRVSSRPDEITLTYSDDHEQKKGELYLPLVQCNECHSTGWLGYRPGGSGPIKTDLRTIYAAYFRHDSDSLCIFPLRNGEDLPQGRGIECRLCTYCGQLQGAAETCQACGDDGMIRVFIPDNRRERQQGGETRVVSENHCPLCGGRFSLMIFGSRVASLASVALHQSFASCFNDDKKLLAFSDSVQDAAHRAGFFAARTWQSAVRMAIAQTLKGKGATPLTQVYTELIRFWRDPQVNPRAMDEPTFISHFIAPNMLWYQDYHHLKETGKLPSGSHLLLDISKRLTWEVLAEFGYRSKIGRSLEKTATVALGIDLKSLRAAVQPVLVPLQEELGLRDLREDELFACALGMVLHLKEQGGIDHPLLKGYIDSGGRNYMLGKISYLPVFAPESPSPIFLVENTAHPEFDTPLKRGKSWYQGWVFRTLGKDRLLADGSEGEILHALIKGLVKGNILTSHATAAGTVWGLNPEHLYLSDEVTVLATKNSRSVLIVPSPMAEEVSKLPPLILQDNGHFLPQANQEHWLRRMYREGELQRIFAAEHTGLLDRDTRQATEADFIKRPHPWSANLLSATPTLEMGIDIGDLSSVLLCSVPPAPANYLQRIGRAGRRDGNALSLTMAAGTPHDLYFYAVPDQMMSGRVEPPGVFLNASAVIERQLTAYCMDSWVATGVDVSVIPRALKQVVDHVESARLTAFPYNFLDFVRARTPDLLMGFLALFGEEFNETTRCHLGCFLTGEEQSIETLETRLIRRLHEVAKERQGLKGRISALKRHIETLKKKPQDEGTVNEVNLAWQERSGLQAVLRSLNALQTLNFFTDEGLLPNYAFPETGVTLRSIIFRKKNDVTPGGRAYESEVFEYVRPGSAAISELAPENRFYAEGRQVKIEQIDLKPEDIESWRFCPRCTFAARILGGDSERVCPRCGDPMWVDVGQRREMVRLRQVIAHTSDRDSRIGDDRDDREPTFYTKQMLVDFSQQQIEQAWKLDSQTIPFGFEYIRSATFREMNFGEYGGDTDATLIAGVEAVRQGFVICRHCGMVQPRRLKEQKHAFTCKVTDRTAATNLLECLYLYREFSSEAVRILLPVSPVAGEDRFLQSFIAALQLGLRKAFGGQVDHLRVMTYHEPLPGGDGRRHFLMLYDSVPGGTGYLKELLHTHEGLLRVFTLAREAMVRCTCSQDPAKDGCYRCLFAYRNSYGMEKTSRSTAVSLFGDILDSSEHFQSVKTVGEIKINPILGSELEALFVEALKRLSATGTRLRIHQQTVQGKPGYFLQVGDQVYTIEPQALLGPSDGVHFPCSPDFLIRPAREANQLKPVAVFLDGFRYHAERISDDSAKRLSLVQSGNFWQWSLTWQDVNGVFAKTALDTRNPFTEELQPQMAAFQEKLAEQLGAGDLVRSRLAVQSPLQQLLTLLEKPNDLPWRHYALSRGMGWLEQSTMTLPSTRDSFFSLLSAVAGGWLRQSWLGAGSEVAAGGLFWDQEGQLLRTLLGIPLASVAQKESSDAHLVILLETERGIENDDFKGAWQGFLRLYNLMQFLPKTGFFTTTGIAKGVYESIPWILAEGGVDRDVSIHQAGELGKEWLEVMTYVDSTLHSILQEISGTGFPVPEVGYELTDASGEIVAEAELAWPNWRVAVLISGDEAGMGGWHNSGWELVHVDAEGEQWAVRLKSILSLRRDKLHE